MKIEESLNYFKRRKNKIQLMEEDCAIFALEKQIPKKPYKEKGRLQNNYFCPVCKIYLGDEKELEYAGLQPKYCQQCGQALDWGENND